MPHTSPSARYDLPWKAAIAHALRNFMVFFFPELVTQIDWRYRPRFRDKELAAIGFGAAADCMVADKLIEIRLRDGSPRWVLIHIEVQAQRDATLPHRMLDYNYRISSEHRQQVASLVLLADVDAHWRPHTYHEELLGTSLTFSFATAKLLDHADRSAELMASDNPFALVTLAHLRTQQARHDPDALYAAKWQLTRLLFEHGWKKQRIIVMFKVINWMMALPEPYQQRYRQAVHMLEKERKMEWISPFEQYFLDKGLQKGLKKGLLQGQQLGLEKGLERGRKEGAAALLERQLTQRFGTLTKTAQRKLARASLEQLQAWSDALPEAESLRELLK